MEGTSCLNCGISSHRGRRYMIVQIGPEMIQQLHQWLPQREFSDEDFVCNLCMNALQRSLNEAESSQSQQQFGHQQVCIVCSRSILRTRSNALQVNTPERILIAARIFPQQLPEEPRVCYACWVATRREIQCNANVDVARQLIDVEESGASSSDQVDIIILQPSELLEIQQPEIETVSPAITTDAADRSVPITLPNYKHTAATPGHCMYPNCINEERPCSKSNEMKCKCTSYILG